MRNTILTTLAAGLLAVAASPTWAGTIDFEGLAQDAGDSVGAIDGVAFHDLFADRDDGTSDTDGQYEGFALFFSAGNTVANNFSLGITTDATGATTYEALSDVSDVRSTPWFAFAGGHIGAVGRQTSVAFDFVSNYETHLTVELWRDGGSVSSQTFDPRFDADMMPLVRSLSFSDANGIDEVHLTITGTKPYYFAMNDLEFNAAVVPLPPAAYLGLGLLAGIAVLRRRRRRD